MGLSGEIDRNRATFVKGRRGVKRDKGGLKVTDDKPYQKG